MDQSHLKIIKSKTKRAQDHNQTFNLQIISRVMKYLLKESKQISDKSLLNPSFLQEKRVSRRNQSLNHPIYANQTYLILNHLKKGETTKNKFNLLQTSEIKVIVLLKEVLSLTMSKLKI